MGDTPEAKANADHESSQDWMTDLVPHIRLHSIRPIGLQPAVSFLLTVQREHCNNMEMLHGGCTATLFDICTTLPLAFVMRPRFWEMLGVSRTLTVTYLAPVFVGEEVVIECEIVQVGKRLATIKGLIKKAGDSLIVATCEHGKYNSGPAARV